MRGKWGKDVCYKVLLIKRSTTVYVLIFRRSSTARTLLLIRRRSTSVCKPGFFNNQVLNLFSGHF